MTRRRSCEASHERAQVVRYAVGSLNRARCAGTAQSRLASHRDGNNAALPGTIEVTATGTSGHGSIPRLDNPVVHLAAAVAALGNWKPPIRLAITITSTPPRNARKCFTELEGDRSCWRRNPAGIRDRGNGVYKSGGKSAPDRTRTCDPRLRRQIRRWNVFLEFRMLRNQPVLECG